MANWYNVSKNVINNAITQCSDGNYKQAIDNAYPFGERKYFPYKQWLKARKEAFNRLGILNRTDKNEIGGLFE